MAEIYTYVFEKVIYDVDVPTEEKIKYLQSCIDFGIDINRNNSEILISAIQQNNYQIVKMLIENGANIHNNNDQPLVDACFEDNYDIVKLLLSLGADVSAQNNEPIVNSIYNENLQITKLLIEYEAHVFSDTNSVFIYACRYSDFKIVEYLINMGVNCNEPNNEPIIAAFERSGLYKMKRLLFDNGANPNAIDGEQMSLLESSLNYCNLENCKLLFEYNADVNFCHNIINNNLAKFTISKKNINSDLKEISNLFLKHGLDIREFINKITDQKIF